MNCQIEFIEVTGAEIKSKRTNSSVLNSGDIINNCTFLSYEGFDIGKVRGEYIKLGKFKCHCGNEFITRISSLKSKHTNSCGCLNKRRVKEANSTHKLSKSPLYFTWKRMLKRCYDENSQDYNNYGARGINVCEEWKNNPINFVNWCNNNGYKKGLSIDRINNDGNYEPSNCRWVNMKEQARNRRSSRLLPFNGKMISMAEYCEINKISYAAISKRLNELGWDEQRALSTEVRQRQK